MDRTVIVAVNVTELGRRGGKARAAALSPKERREAARKAIQVRWAQYYAAHPEKRKTAQTAASRKRKAKQ